MKKNIRQPLCSFECSKQSKRGVEMTQINSVNSTETQAIALGAQTEETDELSESTKKTLEALGIPVTEGMTEAQAQQKIQEARAEQAQVNGETLTETEVMSDVKTLAGQLGVTYSDADDPETIMINIAEELEAQIDEAENNPQELSALMGYFNQLKDLDTTYNDIKDVQNKIFAAMDMVSQKNKQALGLE